MTSEPTIARLLDLPGPIPETITSFLGPAARKVFRLTCKEARELIDGTVQSATVDVGNVRVLCGPWRPLHTTFPQLRHLTVCLRCTGAVIWDVHHAPLMGAAVHGGRLAVPTAGRGSNRYPDGPTTAAAGFSLRLLRDLVPRLNHLRLLDLTQCYVDPLVWRAFCSSGLPRGLMLRLHPAAALPFPGRTWGERLTAMMVQLAEAKQEICVRVVACAAGGGGLGGAACWCDVDGEMGLRKLAEMPYLYEIPVCVWSRAPCQSSWLFPFSSLTRLRRLHISCCNATDPSDHAWLGGLSALVSLQELNLGRTDSLLSFTDLATLSACTALTALSISALTAVRRQQAPGQIAAAVAMQAGLLPLMLPAPVGPAIDESGPLRATDAALAVSPLTQIRLLEIRCCLLAGPVPLGELFPCAVSVSMCALTVSGDDSGGRGNGFNGHGSLVASGHVLQSLMGPSTALSPGLEAGPQRPTLLARLLSMPRPRSQHRVPLQQVQQQGHHRELVEGLLPPPLPAPAAATAAQLRCGLRFLELVQRRTAAITLGPAFEGTGRAPLPDTALLEGLTGLEHLQFTGWSSPGAQLPALLAAAQRLPRLQRLTFRDCNAQCFGWRASRMVAHLALDFRPLEVLVGLKLRSLEVLEVLGSPSLRLLEQMVLACRAPRLRALEVHGVQNWDERTFQRILGTGTRRAVAVTAAAVSGQAARTTTRQSEAATAAHSHIATGGDSAQLSRFLVALPAATHPAGAVQIGGSRRCGEGAGDAVVSCPFELRHFPSGAAPEAAIKGSCSCRAGYKPRETHKALEAKARGALGASTFSDDLNIKGGHITTRGQGTAAEGCSGIRRWPRLSYIAVHGCPGTSLESLKRQAVVAGMGPTGVEVSWMPNTQALDGPGTWSGRQPKGGPEAESGDDGM